MKHFILIVVLVTTANQVFPQPEGKLLDSLLQAFYPKDDPGAALAIIKNRKVILKKGYGITDSDSKKEITLTTNFNIGSLTKQFTAYSVLKLAKEKKFALDDTLGKFFPELIPEIAGRVTVRNLLTHSSGIVDHYNYVNKPLFTEFRDKDVLNAVKDVDSVYFQAGNAYRYSNTAYCLLSLIIERVSGIPFPEYLRKNIFQSLGMDKSMVIHPDGIIPERAVGYANEEGSFKVSDEKESLFFSTMGDGGIYTSIHDYLKWLKALLKGKGLNTFLIKDALSPQFSIDKNRELSYGFGWFVAGSGKNRIIYHTGSNGGFRAITFLKPSEKYGVVIFSNRTGTDLEDLIHRINRILGVDDKAFVKLEALIN